jgi:hypothetical protein
MPVVSLMDGALDAIDQDKLDEYKLSRDISVLELDKLQGEKPTIFHVKSLMRHFADTAYNPLPSDMFHVFCAHVTRIDNLDEPLKMELKGDEKRIELCDENWDALSKEVVMEIGGVIIQMSSRDGDNIPFTPPGTSSAERRIRSRALHAMQAKRIARSKNTAS